MEVNPNSMLGSLLSDDIACASWLEQITITLQHPTRAISLLWLLSLFPLAHQVVDVISAYCFYRLFETSFQKSIDLETI